MVLSSVGACALDAVVKRPYQVTKRTAGSTLLSSDQSDSRSLEASYRMSTLRIQLSSVEKGRYMDGYIFRLMRGGNGMENLVCTYV